MKKSTFSFSKTHAWDAPGNTSSEQPVSELSFSEPESGQMSSSSGCRICMGSFCVRSFSKSISSSQLSSTPSRNVFGIESVLWVLFSSFYCHKIRLNAQLEQCSIIKIKCREKMKPKLSQSREGNQQEWECHLQDFDGLARFGPWGSEQLVRRDTAIVPSRGGASF